MFEAECSLFAVWQGIRISPDYEAGVRVGEVDDFRVQLLFVPQVVVGSRNVMSNTVHGECAFKDRRHSCV